MLVKLTNRSQFHQHFGQSCQRMAHRVNAVVQYTMICQLIYVKLPQNFLHQIPSTLSKKRAQIVYQTKLLLEHEGEISGPVAISGPRWVIS